MQAWKVSFVIYFHTHNYKHFFLDSDSDQSFASFAAHLKEDTKKYLQPAKKRKLPDEAGTSASCKPAPIVLTTAELAAKFEDLPETHPLYKQKTICMVEGCGVYVSTVS